MNLQQSVAVDTAKFATEGLSSIAADVTALKNYLRVNPTAPYCTPQILGLPDPKSIIVLRMRQKKKEVLLTLINPILLAVNDTIAVEERQPGIEGVYLNIRHPQIKVAYVGLPAGKSQEVTLSGKSALVFQQALRLTQGITIDLFGLRIDNYKEYQEGTEEQRQEIIKNYIAALKELNDKMHTDEDTQEYQKAVDYLSSQAEESINSEITSELVKAYKEEEAKQPKDEDSKS